MKTDLVEIFQTIRAQIQPYAVEGFKNKTSTDTAYHLCADPQISLPELDKSEVYFFGVEVKENYVGLYFNPIYTANEMELIFSSDLVEQLEEKNCFHIIKLDELLLQHIINALKSSFKFYKQKGWL